MPRFYTSVILLINKSKEIGEKQFSAFGSRGAKIVPLCTYPFVKNKMEMNMTCVPWVTCGQKKGVHAKGIYLPRGKKNSQQNKITDCICLIYHGIFPPNMQYNDLFN